MLCLHFAVTTSVFAAVLQVHPLRYLYSQWWLLRCAFFGSDVSAVHSVRVHGDWANRLYLEIRLQGVTQVVLQDSWFFFNAPVCRQEVLTAFTVGNKTLFFLNSAHRKDLWCWVEPPHSDESTYTVLSYWNNAHLCSLVYCINNTVGVWTEKSSW